MPPNNELVRLIADSDKWRDCMPPMRFLQG